MDARARHQSRARAHNLFSNPVDDIMAQLQRINLGFDEAETELAEYRRFLRENKTFSERDIISELKKWRHLSCLIGSMPVGVKRADVYKFEFQIQGVFRADLVVGNLQQKSFVFVEFEPGQSESLFGPTETNQMRVWSRHFERGFSQLVDWAWAIQDTGHTSIFRNSFECEALSAHYLLVCGREDSMNSTEEKRFFWRGDNVLLNGRTATCLTYDGLFLFFKTTLEAIKSFR
jgi:hypothetical protein